VTTTSRGFSPPLTTYGPPHDLPLLVRDQEHYLAIPDGLDGRPQNLHDPFTTGLPETQAASLVGQGYEGGLLAFFQEEVWQA
jgi:hypothetical protein